MYRYMIEHPDWLPENGRAELLPHYRLGDDRGRIYRIFPVGTPPRKLTRLDKLTTSELVAALESPNEWQCDKAHMMLLWRGDKSAATPLMKLAAASTNPLARLHALYVRDGLGMLTVKQTIHALTDEHPGVRENALRRKVYFTPAHRRRRRTCERRGTKSSAPTRPHARRME
jgi:hypothetical protein